jgi:hypothetical protein
VRYYFPSESLLFDERSLLVGEKIARLERVQTYLTSKLAEMLQEDNASFLVAAIASGLFSSSAVTIIDRALALLL